MSFTEFGMRDLRVKIRAKHKVSFNELRVTLGLESPN